MCEYDFKKFITLAHPEILNLTASSILIEKEMSEYRREGIKIGNKGKANNSSSEVLRAQAALSIVRVRRQRYKETTAARDDTIISRCVLMFVSSDC